MLFKKISLYQSFLHLSLVVLTVLTLLLTIENRELRGSTGPKPTTGPAVGALMQPFAAKDLSGQDITVSLAERERETLLLVFTTTCPACQENLPNWLALWERFRDRYDFVAISIDSLQATEAYARARALPFEVLVPAEPESFSSRYRIAGVPTTLRVGPDGRVMETWLGILPEDVFDASL